MFCHENLELVSCLLVSSALLDALNKGMQCQEVDGRSHWLMLDGNINCNAIVMQPAVECKAEFVAFFLN